MFALDVIVRLNLEAPAGSAKPCDRKVLRTRKSQDGSKREVPHVLAKGTKADEKSFLGPWQIVKAFDRSDPPQVLEGRSDVVEGRPEVSDQHGGRLSLLCSFSWSQREPCRRVPHPVVRESL